ncbi:MAG: response regulator [Sulfurimonas sp.]|nr:response regulator [Sulfurimonas sp.]
MELKLLLEYTKDLKVLYVEDNNQLLNTTKELLDNYFKTIDTAEDGEDGLNKYLQYNKNYDEYYDIVITDINMPKLDGIEMSKVILSMNPDQEIIITSAHNEVEFLSSAIELGINGFITKPIKNEQLTKVIYKVSQSISNKKFVNSHVEVIENLNLRLEEQNRELLIKNEELVKSFRMLDTMVNKNKLTDTKNEQEIVAGAESDEDLIKAQVQDLIKDDLEELREIHAEIDFAIINIMKDESSVSVETIEDLAEQFIKYASILSFYTFFDELSKSMSNFSSTLKDNPLPENEETVKNIFMLLESFMYVLGKWQDDLSSGDESKINSFDASIISDMHTITNMWTQQETPDTEEDLDNIFDF